MGPETMVGVSALRRMGTPNEIANIAVFLPGAESSYVTGTDILMDDGTVSARKWSRSD